MQCFLKITLVKISEPRLDQRLLAFPFFPKTKRDMKRIKTSFLKSIINIACSNFVKYSSFILVLIFYFIKIKGLFLTRLILIPSRVSEVPHLFTVRSKYGGVSVGSWARVKRGKYMGDLAQVHFYISHPHT